MKLDEANLVDQETNPTKLALREHLPFLKEDSTLRSDFDVKLYADDT
jgi:hypothetical protein